MRKKKQFIQKLIVLLAAVIFLMSATALTAFADPGDGMDNGGAVDDGGADSGDGGDSGYIDDSGDNGGADPDTGDSGDNGGSGDSGDNGSGEQPVDNGGDSGDAQQDDQDGNDSNDGGDTDNPGEEPSPYTPNENLDNLPTVAPGEVIEATAEPLPDVEVSDATLFSGIVMWLCVAVGISVVAGVMVSKRTHRRGS